MRKPHLLHAPRNVQKRSNDARRRHTPRHRTTSEQSRAQEDERRPPRAPRNPRSARNARIPISHRRTPAPSLSHAPTDARTRPRAPVAAAADPETGKDASDVYQDPKSKYQYTEKEAGKWREAAPPDRFLGRVSVRGVAEKKIATRDAVASPCHTASPRLRTRTPRERSRESDRLRKNARARPASKRETRLW